MDYDRQAVEDLLAEVGTACILPHFQHLAPEDIKTKIGDDPVTIADQTAEAALTEGLRKILPGSHVLGEEAFFADPGIAQYFDDPAPLWVVDPLDGTRQFVAGDPTFGMIVALVSKGQTVAGWLYSPLTRQLITAEKGAGAYCQGKRLQALAGGPLPALSGRLGKKIIDAYPFRETPEKDPQAPRFRRLGTACEAYMRLVEGTPQEQFRANYVMATPWDDAAGVLIYSEAGGMAAHWDGAAYDPRAYHVGLLAAPDPDTWASLRTWIAGFCPLPAR